MYFVIVTEHFFTLLSDSERLTKVIAMYKKHVINKNIYSSTFSPMTHSWRGIFLFKRPSFLISQQGAYHECC